MKCPFCGAEMAHGTLHGRGDNFFLPEGETVPMLLSNAALKKHHAIILPPDSFCVALNDKWPPAFWCGKCRRLVVNYEGYDIT